MSNGIPITDPVELAWCAFARDHEEKWGKITGGEHGLSVASFKAGAEWERAACAEVARAAGCICYMVAGVPKVYRKGDDGLFRFYIVDHASFCPTAILAAIEARGRG